MTELSTLADRVPPVSRARAALFKRLADLVCLPASRVNVFERSIVADLLIELLREATPDERRRVARRLSVLSELPAMLARLLLRDEISVAAALIEDCPALRDVDLVDCARMGAAEHRRLIAQRRGVSEVVADALIETGDLSALEVLLRNDLARLSPAGTERVVALTRDAPRLIGPLLRRPELRPSQAYVLFWWADADARRAVLQRFAVSREVLQDAVGDIFAMAAAEGWSDPLSRKALQFIERRQRNRAAIDKSPFASLDDAVTAAGRGMTREIAEEISYLSGLKPATGAKIMADIGGEPLAVLCKAVGLPRAALLDLWRGLRRPEVDAAGAPAPALARVLEVFDIIAVDRAQTVLRYWNWSLSSALTPALIKALREGDEGAVDEYSPPQRAAMLVMSSDFGR
ncbi:hypothetical protein C5708_12660 [Caulobacter sp. CCUG 60055]|uniref:DUF2336 domain-containing protein n=1 Tax=Caulobacter sp. CCUG 60055 TaxID=2100090 RepID=UPI001FA797ED|nr:DUF2336 domain-containing protein [Caulobacter sp. CCUG 60055]MBQ1542827.1 DUF2336 domain-containing protein [Caulobacteraceae bacterium]MCI3181104.1 hypothetical protein [Caulobacter sp. CCUG 60055]